MHRRSSAAGLLAGKTSSHYGPSFNVVARRTIVASIFGGAVFYGPDSDCRGTHAGAGGLPWTELVGPTISEAFTS